MVVGAPGSNMQLEDILAILGRAGTVTLRKGTNDVSAGGGQPDVDGWRCEISLEGYLRPWGHGGSGGSQLRLDGWRPEITPGSRPRGLSALEAATLTLNELDAFLCSDEAAACRECYLEDHKAREARVGKRSDCFNGRYQQPDPPAPEIKLQWD